MIILRFVSTASDGYFSLLNVGTNRQNNVYTKTHTYARGLKRSAFMVVIYGLRLNGIQFLEEIVQIEELLLESNMTIFAIFIYLFLDLYYLL